MVTLITVTAAPVSRGTDRKQRLIPRLNALFLVALVVVATALVGCGGAGSTTDGQPTAVSTTAGGQPATVPPTTVSSGTATLAWAAPSTNVDGTPLTNLAGYKVYYGTTPGIYSSIDVGYLTSCELGGLTKGQTYYFAVTAYDTNNNESDYSTTVSTIIG